MSSPPQGFMHPDHSNFIFLAKGISQLLYPHAEVVIHDLKSGKIAAIFNNFSKRVAGDDSLLEEGFDLSQLPDVFPTYFKRGSDGRRLKSISITIRNPKGEAIALFCINIDVSALDHFQKLIDTFLTPAAVNDPLSLLFKDDWQEKINTYIHDYLCKHHLTLNSLTKEQRHQLIQQLQQEGGFSAPKSADYIAKVLGVSRATIYNHLKPRL